MIRFLWFFIAAICVAAAMYVVIFPTMALFQLLNTDYSSQLLNLTEFLNFSAALWIIIFFPFVEEVVFRGGLFLFPAKRFKISPVLLAMVSSILFMLIHTVIQMPAAFIAGIFLCLVAWWSQSLWLPIIIHIIHNLTTWTLLRFYDEASYEILTAPFAWQPWLISVAVFVGTAWVTIPRLEQTKLTATQFNASVRRLFSIA